MHRFLISIKDSEGTLMCVDVMDPDASGSTARGPAGVKDPVEVVELATR